MTTCFSCLVLAQKRCVSLCIYMQDVIENIDHDMAQRLLHVPLMKFRKMSLLQYINS